VREADEHLSSVEIDVLLCRNSADLHDAGQIEGESAETLRHLATCGMCQSTLDVHRQEQNRLERLKGSAQTQPGAQCPPEIEWLRVAAREVDASAGAALVRHAALCDHCGPLLLTAVRDFDDELTPDEEAVLDNLESSRESWQRRFASDICPSRSRWSLRSWVHECLSVFSKIPIWANASAIVVVAVAAFLVMRAVWPTPVETLLATAYTDQRPFDLRIPMAAHAPVRLTKGAVSRSGLDRPPALLEAEARIARELQQHPTDPALLQARGRAELLEWNYPDAIRSLKQALDLAPATQPLMIDLASAYFERAEASQNRASDYAAAVELLDQALKSKPDDPVALFNRAIILERMDLNSRAIEDWRHYLRVDPDREWASEARKRLVELEHKETRPR
jgi:tetratricopeptide (TPR) repeat protein